MSLSRPKQHSWGNKFSYDEAVGRAAIALLGHPFDYVKILIQLGYEPLPPYATKTIFGTPRLALPNVFQYLGHIRQTDGQFGWFRGVKYKIASSILYQFVYVNISDITKNVAGGPSADDDDDEDTRSETSESLPTSRSRSHPPTFSKENISRVVEGLLRETFCKFVALAAAYPLQVMVVRSCAQFIGRETIYDSLREGFRDIWENSGWRGFYAGFMPRFLYDVFLLWSTHGLLLLVKGSVLDRLKSDESDRTPTPVESYVGASINFLLASTMYPFHVVSTVMACNGKGAASLEASGLEGREFADWTECWKHLSSMGQLKRGSSLLWRYKPVLRTSFAGLRVILDEYCHPEIRFVSM